MIMSSIHAYKSAFGRLYGFEYYRVTEASDQRVREGTVTAQKT